MTDHTARFSDRVADYVRYRPGYPPAVIDFLRETCGLAPGWVVADVGAGPGNLSRPFLDAGAAVLAVEPNGPMRAAGEALLGDRPGFRAVAGAAEATGLADASVDLVAAGQAFHWFDRAAARREFARILRPPGWVALVWNDRPAAGSPFLEDYEAMLLAFGTDYAAVRHQDAAGDDAIAAFFAPNPVARASFPNLQSFDRDGLAGRLRSSSYAPPPGHPNHEPLMARLDGVFARHRQDGRIDFPYATTVYVGRLLA